MRNLAILCGLAALLAVGCGSDQPEVKNRVPTMQGQLDAAQKAANDAKASADNAAQTKKDIQAAIDKLNGVGADSNGNRKIGTPEVTGIGTITGVGYVQESKTSEGYLGDHSILYFIFAEKAGFTKKFGPVCNNQTLPTNKTVALNYHWHEYEDKQNPGCFMIDGYTVVQ